MLVPSTCCTQLRPTSLPGAARLLTRLKVPSRFAHLSLTEMLAGVGQPVHAVPAATSQVAHPSTSSTQTGSEKDAAGTAASATPGTGAAAPQNGAAAAAGSVAAGERPLLLDAPAHGWHSVRLLLSEHSFRERAAELGRLASSVMRVPTIAHTHSAMFSSAGSGVGRPHVWDPQKHASEPFLEVQYCVSTWEDVQEQEEREEAATASHGLCAISTPHATQAATLQAPSTTCQVPPALTTSTATVPATTAPSHLLTHPPLQPEHSGTTTAPPHIIEIRPHAPRPLASARHVPEFDLPAALQPHAHTYAHGGFMGAACSLVADPAWMDILVQATDEVGDVCAAAVCRELIMCAAVYAPDPSYTCMHCAQQHT